MGTVDELIRQLQSGNNDERRKAAIELGKLGDSVAVPALLQTADDSDEDSEVRIAAVWAVGQIGDLNAVPALLDTYLIAPNRLAEKILYTIGEILSRTSSDDDNSREVFSQAVDTLIGIVSDDWTSEEVRVAAAKALGKSRDPKAIPVLTRHLHEYQPIEVAKAAAFALRHFDDPQAIHALAKAAINTGFVREVRETAVESLGDIGNPEVVDTLISILEDQSVDNYIRAEAARALGRIGNPKAIEPLIRTMENETGWEVGTLFTAIVEALGAFRDPRVTDALVRALSYDYQSARTAAETLKKHRDRRAVEPLIRILDDDAARHDTHTRRLAAEVLGVLGDPRAIPALAKALREEDCGLDILQLFCEEIRKAASESLLAFVPAHPDAILRLPPDDRHRLGRLIQDSERNELAQKLCN